ncbi:MAG: hypothetical protein KatS3mg104_3056 [Phycisphaerae bacterium]|nr:MAG: hypothetical protein KatS3mg104_3056 [Phycisphaerae bacterium]
MSTVYDTKTTNVYGPKTPTLNEVSRRVNLANATWARVIVTALNGGASVTAPTLQFVASSDGTGSDEHPVAFLSGIANTDSLASDVFTELTPGSSVAASAGVNKALTYVFDFDPALLNTNGGDRYLGVKFTAAGTNTTYSVVVDLTPKAAPALNVSLS